MHESFLVFMFYVPVFRYQDFGVDGGAAAKSLSPKFRTASKRFTTQTGLKVPDFEVIFYSLYCPCNPVSLSCVSFLLLSQTN